MPKIDKEDHILTVAEWLDDVADGMFIDYDGYGEAIVWDGVSEDYVIITRGPEWGDSHIYPSEKDKVPPEATHINWYNR